MRLWSIHPRYLDTKGILGLWREALLAQKVLLGGTKGYKNHPQLERFYNQPNSLIAIGAYLKDIYMEARIRGYSFDKQKIIEMPEPKTISIPVKRGQIEFEKKHLLNKLTLRNPEKCSLLKANINLHPIFYSVPGGIESWEKL
jgi:hypothetical protein